MNRSLAALACIVSVAAIVLAARSQVFTYVDVDGRMLRMLVQGNGPATVVFENGLGPPLEIWGKVQPAVSRFARTVTYDRAGVGLSANGPLPTNPSGDGRRVAADVHRALQLATLPPPYVLVGHSLGGPYARVFAGLYPHDVAGMVLVDPTPDSARFDVVRDAQAIAPPSGIPVLLIRAVGPPEVPFLTQQSRTARAARRDDIAAESREHEAWIAGVGGRLIVTERSGHNVPVEQPGLVVDTIRRLIEHR